MGISSTFPRARQCGLHKGHSRWHCSWGRRLAAVGCAAAIVNWAAKKFKKGADLAVKASWAQQGIIQDVGTVGGGHHDDARVALKPIHLCRGGGGGGGGGVKG